MPALPQFVRRHALVVLAIMAVSLAIVTYIVIAWSSDPFGPDPNTVLPLLLLDLTLLLVLLSTVMYRGFRLWNSWRQGTGGARLQTRLIATFGIITIVPTVLVSIFAAVFLNYGIQAWFNQRMDTVLNESVAVAEAYLAEHSSLIRADVLAMAHDLNRNLTLAFQHSSRFHTVVSGQAALRSLSEAVVWHKGRIVGHTRFSFSVLFERIPPEWIERADRGEVVIITDDPDKVRAFVKLAAEDTYLLIGRLIDGRVRAHMENTQGAVQEYTRLKSSISRLQLQFFTVFGLVSCILLFAAIGYGLYFAGRMAMPIGALAQAADRVRAGDFSTRVAVPHKPQDELGSLGQAFNRMTRQLQQQHHDLITVNRELSERRHFIEAVLAGVSSSVLVLDAEYRVTLYNRAAASLLHASELAALEGVYQKHIQPHLHAMLEQITAEPSKAVQGEIAATLGGAPRTLHVRIAAEQFDARIKAYIVTLEDITDLIIAQRHAAWADVARRVAHEIKNPLTPIQLSAERLKRKFLPEDSGSAQQFARYVDTITKHVADIGLMVEEFVSFARMPQPHFAKEEVHAFIHKAVFSQKVAHPEITYTLELSASSPVIYADGGQLERVLMNVLKNAAEAIKEHTGSGSIVLKTLQHDGHVDIVIEDDGPGFPAEVLHRVLEPYVTTRSKGTGLGLAIVKKTLEEHKAKLELSNRPQGGARVVLTFECVG